ncbi:hypothetical protein Tamer19_47560 [Cupriavidus sp. TA19]|nr:hypothetical protein Tamer19_47560 [Cupriavidus sp. TA19]
MSGTVRASAVRRCETEAGRCVPTCGIDTSSGRVPRCRVKAGVSVEKDMFWCNALGGASNRRVSVAYQSRISRESVANPSRICRASVGQQAGAGGDELLGRFGLQRMRAMLHAAAAGGADIR